MSMKIDTKQKDAIKAFESFGFEIKPNKNSHVKMVNKEGKTISLPDHKTLKGSTLSTICRTVGIDKKEFFARC